MNESVAGQLTAHFFRLPFRRSRAKTKCHKYYRMIIELKSKKKNIKKNMYTNVKKLSIYRKRSNRLVSSDGRIKIDMASRRKKNCPHTRVHRVAYFSHGMDTTFSCGRLE